MNELLIEIGKIRVKARGRTTMALVIAALISLQGQEVWALDLLNAAIELLN